MADRPVSVRRANLGDDSDIDRYLYLLDAYARDPMGAGIPLPADVIGRLRRDMPSHPTAHALLAFAGDEVIGFVTGFLGYSTFRAMPLLNIHDIAVLPAWRGRGIARRLLRETEALGRSLGCCRITLEVRDDNPRVRSVYDQAGFVPAACNLFMEKAL
ncbi:MAG: GNAT family N-acetyltransferase [Gammaproteobacteria bacterium]|nr:GNAT family N-acetyltransferase [Gammaproteobacteria bacterium]